MRGIGTSAATRLIAHDDLTFGLQKGPPSLSSDSGGFVLGGLQFFTGDVEPPQ